MCGSDIHILGGVLSDAMEFVHCVEIYLANIGKRLEHLHWCAYRSDCLQRDPQATCS